MVPCSQRSPPQVWGTLAFISSHLFQELCVLRLSHSIYVISTIPSNSIFQIFFSTIIFIFLSLAEHISSLIHLVGRKSISLNLVIVSVLKYSLTFISKSLCALLLYPSLSFILTHSQFKLLQSVTSSLYWKRYFQIVPVAFELPPP